MEPSDNLYSEILAGSPSQATLFLVLSRMKKEGMLERVIEECSKALEIYPDDIRIRQLLAEAYLEAGRISDAESALETIIRKVRDLISCFRLQADLFIRQGREKEALEALKIYLMHHPEDRDSYMLLESMERIEETPPGIEQAPQEPKGVAEEGAVSDVPEIATATLAEEYFNQGNMKVAIDIYEKVVGQNPDDTKTRARLEELKAIMEEAHIVEEKERDLIMRKKKMISILESWLEGIREQSKTGLSLG